MAAGRRRAALRKSHRRTEPRAFSPWPAHRPSPAPIARVTRASLAAARRPARQSPPCHLASTQQDAQTSAGRQAGGLAFGRHATSRDLDLALVHLDEESRISTAHHGPRGPSCGGRRSLGNCRLARHALRCRCAVYRAHAVDRPERAPLGHRRQGRQTRAGVKDHDCCLNPWAVES
eukprot:5927439-Prymnesium_polylepis.2